MPRPLHLLLATVAGFILGSVVNMALIKLGGTLIPAPAGTDMSTMEGLKAALPLFQPEHFLFPFLAHALGTLAGALVAALAAPQASRAPAWAVGVLFLMGGVANVFMLPGPVWFNAADVLLAYLPMAWLGLLIAARIQQARSAA